MFYTANYACQKTCTASRTHAQVQRAQSPSLNQQEISDRYRKHLSQRDKQPAETANTLSKQREALLQGMQFTLSNLAHSLLWNSCLLDPSSSMCVQATPYFIACLFYSTYGSYFPKYCQCAAQQLFTLCIKQCLLRKRVRGQARPKYVLHNTSRCKFT